MKIINPSLMQQIPAAPVSSETSSHPDDYDMVEAIDPKISGEVGVEKKISTTPQDHKP